MIPLAKLGGKFAANLGDIEEERTSERQAQAERDSEFAAQLGAPMAKTGFDAFVEQELAKPGRAEVGREALQKQWQSLGHEAKARFDAQANSFNERFGLQQTSSYSADPEMRGKQVEADIYRDKDGFTTRPVEGSADDISRNSNFQARLSQPSSMVMQSSGSAERTDSKDPGLTADPGGGGASAQAKTPAAGNGQFAANLGIRDIDNSYREGFGNAAEGSPQANFEARVATGEPLSSEEIAQAGRYAAKLGTTFDPEVGYDRRPALAREGNSRMESTPESERPSADKASSWAAKRGMSFTPELGFTAEPSAKKSEKEKRPGYGGA